MAKTFSRHRPWTSFSRKHIRSSTRKRGIQSRNPVTKLPLPVWIGGSLPQGANTLLRRWRGAPGAGKPNPHCSAFKPQEVDKTENAQSVGSHITFGKFHALHLGDLTWNKEFDLMCPQNRVGTVDLWITSHHGLPVSNSEVLAHAIHPRVAIMNNGTRKGGQPEAMKIIHSIPGLEDLWQIHFSQLSGQEYTVPGMFIANSLDDQSNAMPLAPIKAPTPGPNAPPPPAHNGPAHWIKVAAQTDGTFTVTN